MGNFLNVLNIKGRTDAANGLCHEIYSIEVKTIADSKALSLQTIRRVRKRSLFVKTSSILNFVVKDEALLWENLQKVGPKALGLQYFLYSLFFIFRDFLA